MDALDPPHPRLSRSESALVLRAAISSGAATLADGLLYESVLFVSLKYYGMAALLGALAGAVTNFILNRHWTFTATETRILRQIARYTAVSGLTFLGLRGLLWLFIEVLAQSARLAWLPAKILAFFAISYPLQRLWVFHRGTDR
ncbi:MAG: GtrA family protein [Polyangiaceae bacterium]